MHPCLLKSIHDYHLHPTIFQEGFGGIEESDQKKTRLNLSFQYSTLKIPIFFTILPCNEDICPTRQGEGWAK